MVLASASPRRRELLALLGVPFEVVPADIDEGLEAESPRALVEALALAKARAVLGRLPAAQAAGVVVVGADTVVALGARVLGKPGDEAEARATLAALRGRTHEVHTGVAVLAGPVRLVCSVTTEVRMRAYSEIEVSAYVARRPPANGPYDGPYDKAGAYALQDATFAPVAEARGCVCSVVGLPLWAVHDALGRAGVESAWPPLERCAACPEAGARGLD